MTTPTKLLTTLAAACALASISSTAIAGRFLPSTGVPVEGQFIVVFKDEIPGLSRAAQLTALAAQHNGAVTRVFEHALQGGVVQMNDKAAEALARNPQVDVVEQDSVVQLIVPNAVTATSTQSGATGR